MNIASFFSRFQMSSFFMLLYPLVAILSLSGYLPQIYKLLQATSSQDNFALSSWMTWIITAAISLGYGVFHLKDVMFCITTGSGLVFMLIMVSLILYNRHYRFHKPQIIRA